MAIPAQTSPFLDLLPPELRLRIYEHLLVANTPLQGVVARRSTKYALSTSILRTNKQIYAEARACFFSRNTFHISSLPPVDTTDADTEGSGAFEPPLQAKDLPLIRHLVIDPLYYPKTLTTVPGARGWKPVCPAAERYIMNLTHILAFVRSTLLSLSFATDTRPYAGFSDEAFGASAMTLEEDDERLDDALDVKKILTSFHVIEGNLRFRQAVRELSAIRSVAVSFNFPESDFQFQVEKAELCKRGLLFLASQTIFARSEIKIKAMLEGMGDDELEGVEEGDAVLLAGQRRESVVEEARRIVEAMK
ncbi:hypothetical protein N0V91_001883 [Didymella pomorum]|jgi:hypothetical protein|uniref:F-box domain-containing protein n=1 Tax=Didymella pomorum TaxID=749634 RepID=A0A9W8ZL16_9PLEO|nr:hypothetical protein N0V91_001883 [Didymella pomorum]